MSVNGVISAEISGNGWLIQEHNILVILNLCVLLVIAPDTKEE
jgi:hypothetical protein